MTHRWSRRAVLGLAVLALGGFVVAGATTPAAAKKAKTKKSEGKLVKYDAEASTVTVKVKGKPTVFNVKAEGSVLTRTTVTINAKPAKLHELPEGAPVVVYWRRDEKDPKKKFARKIDAPKVPKELLEGYD